MSMDTDIQPRLASFDEIAQVGDRGHYTVKADKALMKQTILIQSHWTVSYANHDVLY